MGWLIWIGTAVSALGLAGLVYCIVLVARAKRAQLSDDEMRSRLKKVLPVNLAALLLSAFGLMMVVVGIALG